MSSSNPRSMTILALKKVPSFALPMFSNLFSSRFLFILSSRFALNSSTLIPASASAFAFAFFSLRAPRSFARRSALPASKAACLAALLMADLDKTGVAAGEEDVRREGVREERRAVGRGGGIEEEEAVGSSGSGIAGGVEEDEEGSIGMSAREVGRKEEGAVSVGGNVNRARLQSEAQGTWTFLRFSLLACFGQNINSGLMIALSGLSSKELLSIYG